MTVLLVPTSTNQLQELSVGQCTFHVACCQDQPVQAALVCDSAQVISQAWSSVVVDDRVQAITSPCAAVAQSSAHSAPSQHVFLLLEPSVIKSLMLTAIAAMT